jgi:signal transduction histidine kinase
MCWPIRCLHFEPQKLVYFVLMALVFATSAPTRRVALISVVSAIAGLVWMARHAAKDLVDQYMFVGLAGAFAAIGMSVLMRGVVGREVRARLASDTLNADLERELAENRRLQTEAQALALTAETANRAKTDFLATMSHEIRTPLNGVLGMAQIMARVRWPPISVAAWTPSPPRAIRCWRDQRHSRHLQDRGRQDGHRPAPFDLSAQLDALRQLYGGLARDKDLDFSLEVSADADGWRQGDAERLRQVLSNLISNAVKFTDAGAVRVIVDGDDQSLSARVLDTGVGIAEAQRERLFTKFVQLDSSSTRRAGGTGLGLAICKTLVELMGGTHRLLGPAEGGACFSINCRWRGSSSAAAPTPARDIATADRRGRRAAGSWWSTTTRPIARCC